MPFLVRGKARSRLNRQKQNVVPVPVSEPPKIEESPITMETLAEEPKISYQEVTYRVPKEERLLDLPLEEEVEEEYSGSYDELYEYSQKESDEVAIGVVLKKKRKR